MRIFIDNIEFKADTVVISDKAIVIRNLIPVTEKQEEKEIKLVVYANCKQNFEINPESFI